MNDFASAVFRIIHDVPEAPRLCECGTPRVVINRVISEQLDIVPMQVRVLQHIRLVYGCAASEHAPVTAAPAAATPAQEQCRCPDERPDEPRQHRL